MLATDIITLTTSIIIFVAMAVTMILQIHTLNKSLRLRQGPSHLKQGSRTQRKLNTNTHMEVLQGP